MSGKKKSPYNNLFWAKTCSIILALYIFVYIDLFNLETYSNKMSQDLSTRLFSYFYPKEPDDIIIVNTDEESSAYWPPSYSEYAQWIEFITDYNPKAIVIDINFEERRNPAQKKEFIEVLSDATENGIKIYGISNPQSDKEIAQWLTPIGTRWELLENGYYPIRDINGKLMAGPQVFNDLYTTIDSNWSVPMFLKWPNRPHAENKSILQKTLYGIKCTYNCGNKSESQPYFDKFTVQNMYVPDSEAHSMFNNRIVFFGSERPASKDFFDNPIYGQVPGVFLHAMALDNLIKYQSNYYKRDDSKPIFAGQGSGSLIEILLLLFNFNLFMRFEHRLGLKNLQKIPDACHALKKVCIYALLCLFLTVVATTVSYFILRNDPSNLIGLMASNLFAYELAYLVLAVFFAALLLILNKIKLFIVNDKNYWRS